MAQFAAVSGRNKEGVYAQAVGFQNFLAVVLLRDGTNSLEVGQRICEQLQERATDNSQITAEEMVHHSGAAEGVSIAVAEIKENTLAVAGKGEVKAKLLRGGKIINLLENPVVVKGLRGPSQSGDLLVLGTSRFWETINLAQLDTQTTPEEIKEQIIPLMENSEQQEEIAGVIWKADTVASSPMATVGTQTRNVSVRSFLSSIKRDRNWFSAKRKIVFLAFLALITLISLVAFQLRSRALEERVRVVSQVEKQVQENIDGANKLVGLNDQVAREMLVSARTNAEQEAQKAFGDDWREQNFPEKARLLAVFDQLDKALGKATHIYKVGLSNFSDYSLLKANVAIKAAALQSGTILALDQNNGSVYSLSTSTKTAAIVTGLSDLKQGQFLDFVDNKIYVWTASGIYFKNRGNSEPPKQVIKAPDKWGGIKSFAYFGGNLYLLDPKNNQIWKYQGTEGGFGEIGNYVREGASLNLGKTMQMKIDGYVYVLSESGNLVRMSSGVADDFGLSGLPDPLGKVGGFYTSDETKNLYLWDRGKNRVVVVDKKGLYLAQYLLAENSLGADTIILADEKVQKVFLISGAKVFSFDLQ